MNGQIALPPTEDEHLDNTALENEARLHDELFRAFSYEDLVKRDKASLDIFWLKDESLETALERFRDIEDELKD